MPAITVQDFNSLSENHINERILDVRTSAEFDEIHIPGSIHIPLDQLTGEVLRNKIPITAGTPFYIVCRSGTRADIAAQKLDTAGITDGIVIKGGILAWKEAGLPVVQGERRVISLERQVRIAAGSIILSGFALAWLIHPYFLGLSVFVGAGLIFAGLTDWCGMGLLIAKAPWNRRRA